MELNKGKPEIIVILSSVKCRLSEIRGIREVEFSFCAFYRRPGDKEAYTLSVEQVMEKIKSAADQGATTVLLQGGLNPELPLTYYTDLIRETRRRFPQVTPHFFTASEVHMMAEVSGKSTREVLSALKEAGQVSLPGGGAEVLSEYVRQAHFAQKKSGRRLDQGAPGGASDRDEIDGDHDVRPRRPARRLGRAL